MTPFTSRVVEIIQAIPEGKVMTYGQIAGFAGSPRAARQVVRILHSMSKKYNLPWHRVVNASGEIAVKDDESNTLQRMMLESEGIKLLGNRVELADCQYQPAMFDFDEDHF